MRQRNPRFIPLTSERPLLHCRILLCTKQTPLSAAFGGLAVGVPGEVRGLDEAYRRWGTLPWKRLVEPSVALAAGWEVDKELGRRIPVSKIVMELRHSH